MDLPEPYKDGLSHHSDVEQVEACGDELLRLREKFGEDTFQTALSALEIHDAEQ